MQRRHKTSVWTATSEQVAIWMQSCIMQTTNKHTKWLEGTHDTVPLPFMPKWKWSESGNYYIDRGGQRERTVSLSSFVGSFRKQLWHLIGGRKCCERERGRVRVHLPEDAMNEKNTVWRCTIGLVNENRLGRYPAMTTTLHRQTIVTRIALAFSEHCFRLDRTTNKNKKSVFK